jgi:hypothetical protein
MKKRIPHKQVHNKNSPKAREAKTGEHCPLNGWWVPAGREAGSHFISEGSIMPPNRGQSVTWTMVASQFGSRKPKYAHPAAGTSIDSF